MKVELTKSDNENFYKMASRNLTGTAKWKDIEDLINRWARRNPRGAVELEHWIREARAGLSDKKFGKLNNDALVGGRIGVMIHPELMTYIEAFYPKFLQTKEELHEFERRFPKFRVPEGA